MEVLNDDPVGHDSSIHVLHPRFGARLLIKRPTPLRRSSIETHADSFFKERSLFEEGLSNVFGDLTCVI